MAAAAAAPEPEIAPKSIFAMTLVWASAPGIRPAMTLATLTRRSAMPPLFIRLPANMKKGIAIREKEFAPAKSRWALVAKEISAGSMQSMATALDRPTDTLMDTPIANMATSRTTITMAVWMASDMIRQPPLLY